MAVYCPSDVSMTQVHDMPTTRAGKGKLTVDPRALANLIGGIAFDFCTHSLQAVVENVGSRPRQAGAFNFGLSTGLVHGVLAGQGIPFDTVSPVQWKGAMGLHKQSPLETTEENKDRARAVAAKLFPHMAECFKWKKDDGRAEALLLAVYYANRRKP